MGGRNFLGGWGHTLHVYQRIKIKNNLQFKAYNIFVKTYTGVSHDRVKRFASFIILIIQQIGCCNIEIIKLSIT